MLSAPSPEHDVAAVPVTPGALAFALIGPASITCSAVSQSLPLGGCRVLIGQVWSGTILRRVGRVLGHSHTSRVISRRDGGVTTTCPPHPWSV